MIYEIKNVKQISGEKKRRWFEDNFFELIVWYGNDNRIASFQLCYDRYGKERALTWNENGRYFHDKVDYGDHFHNIQTPILVSDGPFEGEEILNRFIESSQNIEKDISLYVIGKLTDYIKK